MKTKDIFLGLNYIGEDLIAEAENGTFAASRKETKRTGLFRKPFFLAALIALMVFLMGCAWIVLRMQDINLGQNEVTYDAYDYDTLEYLGTESYTEEVFTVAGLKGTPGYEAALEWFNFLQTYDPDRVIQSAVWGNYPEFPAEYETYYLYSQEMKDTLDGILNKYSLKPVGASLNFRNTRNMCAALGVERLQTTQNGVTVRIKDGGCYENGNFLMNLDIQLPDAAENEVNATWGVLRWNRSDCFSDDVIAVEDMQEWKEWNYTTASGTKVLIIRADSDWRGYILCPRPEGILSLQVETRKDLWNQDGENTWAEELFLTDKQMEQIADAIDFGIQPRIATREDVNNQPAPSNAATQDGYTVQLKSIETDGWIVRIVMSITAPEGTVISRNPHPGFADEAYHINPANYDSFECQTGEVVASSGGWNLLDDGDGLENTQDIVMVNSVRMDDGSAPFGPGMVWNIYFADIMGNYWDAQYNTLTDILAEGEWLFPITFDETIGDYTEKELIRDPITVGVSVGWKPDGSDVVEDMTVTSVKLRKFSCTIGHNGSEGTDFSFLNGQPMMVVMKDGTQIQLCYGAYGCYEADTAIDPEQVDHIAFADGTKLPVPEA